MNVYTSYQQEGLKGVLFATYTINTSRETDSDLKDEATTKTHLRGGTDSTPRKVRVIRA